MLKAVSVAGSVRNEQDLVTGSLVKLILGATGYMLKETHNLKKVGKSLDREFGEHKTYRYGEHVKLTLTKHVGPTEKLEDGVVIVPGANLLNVDVIRGLGQLSELNEFAAARLILIDFLSFLIELADDVKKGVYPESVIALTGLSHLAGTEMSQKLGFEVRRPRFVERIMGAIIGVRHSKENELSQYQNFKTKWRMTQRTFMSLDSVVKNEERYRKLLERLKRTS